MLTDARELEPGTMLRGDVCVVGAGPAGITLALALAAAGRRVLLLESGGQGRGRREQDGARAESVGESYFPVHRSRVRGFGGTSLHWRDNGWFRARPLDPIDLGARPEIGREGWPLDRGDLDRWYPAAHDMCRLGEFDYDPARWASDERPLLPLDPSLVETSIFQLTPFTTWVDRFDEVAGHPAIDLVLHATVLDVATDDRPDRVDRLHVRGGGGGGGVFEAHARTFVLATGGLENARLLLLSDRTHEAGLGNDHDLVGRFFMEHLAVRSGTWRLDADLLRDGLGLYLAHRPDDRPLRIHAKLSLAPEVLRDHALLNGTFFLYPMTENRAHPATHSFVVARRAASWRPRPPDLGAHVRRVLRHPGVVARTGWDEVRRLHRRRSSVVQLMAMSEQAPNAESRVTLGTSRDRFDQRRLRLDWRRTDLDRRSVRAAQDLLSDALGQAGLGTLEDRLDEGSPAAMLQPQWHHMGTTRMDPDPARGVVDTDGRVHGIENLYVAGSSVFPTAGYANPTLTIVALALRLADHLHGTVDA